MIWYKPKLNWLELKYVEKRPWAHSIIERYLKCQNWECKFNLWCDKKVVLDIGIWTFGFQFFGKFASIYLLVRLLYLVVSFNFMFALKTKFSHTFASHLLIYVYTYYIRFVAECVSCVRATNSSQKVFGLWFYKHCLT